MPRLASAGAQIDIATNFATFNSIDFSRDFQDFVDGDLRVEHLLTLIHEVTHHWCLITPVGTALAARTFHTYHDAAYVAASSIAGTSFPHERNAKLDSSIFTSRVLTSFFVPLLEGLALYAEWRACPAAGGIFSRPFDFLNFFVDRHDHLERHKEILDRMAQQVRGRSIEETKIYIQSWLNSDESRQLESELTSRINLELSLLRKKEGERSRLRKVLESFIDPRKGSYQLGYLFVCSLERVCQAHANTDMLLAFLRDYFFNDPDLAALILDEDLPWFDLYSKVRERLQSKVFELLDDPQSTAARVQQWGAEVPIASVPASDFSDFFGRPGAAFRDVRTRHAHENYAAKLHDFCESVSSPVVSQRTLKNFLVGGRILMPIGSSNFVVLPSDGDYQKFEAADGSKLSISSAKFSKIPNVGEAVTVSMLVNVAAPGTAISLRWNEHFEAILLREDTISKPIIEHVYRHSERIKTVVNVGQDVIGKIHRETETGTEGLEAFVDDFLDSDKVSLDIIQIYRAAIVVAFSSEKPDLNNSRWREKAFKAWEPQGIATLLADRNLLHAFAEVCGMPPYPSVPHDELLSLGAADSEEKARQISDDLFEAANRMSKTRYLDIVSRANTRFSSQGWELFGETMSGELASFI